MNSNLTHQQQKQPNFVQQQPVEEHRLPHLMPLPSATPWNLDSMPWTVATKSIDQSGGVMQFSAQKGILEDSMQKRGALLHHKRKSNIVAPHPPKQFISEEKITAHFNGLHISSDYIQHNNDSDFNISSMGQDNDDGNARPTTSGKSFTNLTYRDYQLTAKELEEKLKKANRITMCEEIKKMHEEQKMVSFMPQALLNRIEKPCTALVLWQPPPILNLLQTPLGNKASKNNYMRNNRTSGENNIDDITFEDPSSGIDDFVDNNNTCNLDFNNLKPDGMDTDL